MTTLDQLTARLAATAAALPSERTAVSVLVIHGRWLHHRGFIVGCVRAADEHCWVHWPVIRRFLSRTPCPEVDEEVLLLASEVALWQSGRRLRTSTVLAGLDPVLYRHLTAVVGPELAERAPRLRR